MIRAWLAAIDAALCVKEFTRPRYQAALKSADGEILPVDTAVFRHRANADWWATTWVMKRATNQAAVSLGAQWIVVEL